MWLLLVATSFAPLASFAYDAQNQTTAAYDRSGESAVGYDAASVLATGAKKNGTVGDRVSFAKSAEFLAAKGAEALAGKLYHYTGAGNAESILQNDLGAGGRRTFATPAGNLSPVQAHPISLSNPNRQTYLDAAQQFLQGGNP